MSGSGRTTSVRRKKRRRRRRAPLFPFVLLALFAAGLFWAAHWLVSHRTVAVRADLPADYNGKVAVLDQEYLQYYGVPVPDSQPVVVVGQRKPTVRAGGDKIHGAFRQAATLASQRNYPGAAAVLEALTKDAPLPVVFADLGILYTILGDYGRAGDVFREVLVRDSAYAPVRQFLRATNSLPPSAVEPFAREEEPNNEFRTANLIALRTQVGGEVGPAADDVDFFRIVAPPAPRDLLAISITNHTANFSPSLHVYDANFRLAGWGEKTADPGESIQVTGGPAPNSNLYISISAANGKGGLYVLTVTPQKAFDSYEPNDDISMARRIGVGQDVNANIMDGEDTDYFSFVSPRQGTVKIEIRNGSATLVPAITVYDADRRNIGYGPDLKKPGLDLQHTISVEKDAVYYVQVWSPAGAGAYTLRID